MTVRAPEIGLVSFRACRLVLATTVWTLGFLCVSHGQSQEPIGANEVETDSLDPAAIEQAIANLDHTRFHEREAAFRTLINAGSSAIDALEKNAKRKEVEVRRRCIEALVVIARDEQNLTSVVGALERLSTDPTCISANLAGKHVISLTMTDEDRAAEKLTAQGVRLHRRQDGEVTSVSVMSDRHLALLRHFPSISSVSISGIQVTNKGLDHLSKLKSLSSLSINQSQITDNGLAKLKSLENLRTISLRATEFSGFGLSKLKDVPKLVHISLSTSVDEDDLRGLVQVPQVRSLYMSEVEMGASTAELLNQMDHVTQCNLSMRDATDYDLRWLSEVELPISLNLYSTPTINSRGWKYLSEANIQGLNLSNMRLTDKDLVFVGEIRSLTRLTLSSNSLAITNSGIEHLRNLDKLQYLYLRGAKNVTQDAMDDLKSEMKSLRTAHLR
ncbi:MAG: hypothetical protein AAGG48_23600 [Planctomycetota bacterium]